ncbi:MAG: DUF1566 domain-containing protein [Rikenellaceae bacterium]|nr:DUF1566 domain-containing protein [Rikenellaceae bacterium]
MKRFALYILLLALGTNIAVAQERHYYYSYSGTTYETTSGGRTTMTNKQSSARLKGGFTASILPDRKTIWICSSAINEQCTGSSEYKNGGYSYSSRLSFEDYLDEISGYFSSDNYTLRLIDNDRQIICVSYERSGADHYLTRFDYYSYERVVAKPNNPLREKIERNRAELAAESKQLEAERAKREAQRMANKASRERALKNSVGNYFPMAYFVDSHGKRVGLSYFKRGKKTLVMTFMAGCMPAYKLKKELEKYPQVADQIVTIFFSQTDYSKYNSDRQYIPNRLYLNPNMESNSSWLYGESCPCIILVDENGRVMSYKFGYDSEKDVKYIANLVGKMRVRTSAPYKVGDHYYDGKSEGVVFEVYDNGYSGKIVSLTHSERVKRWRNSGSLDISKTFGITDGRDIIYYKRISEGNNGDDAFGWCNRIGLEWYLPTIDELKAIYKNRSLIEPKLTDKLTAVYWSSTEYNANEAYYTTEGAGRVAHAGKHYGCHIRAVRTFGKRVPRAKQKTTSAPYKVGDFYNENNKWGVVFEVNADGTSGKIVDPLLFGKSAWAADKSLIHSIIGANSTTDGQYNTKVISSTDDWETKYPAFETITRYVGKGWYIPSVAELRSIYNTQDCYSIPLYSKGLVWSSTEHSKSQIGAVAFDLSTGKTYVEDKDKELFSYAINTFGEVEKAEKRTFDTTSAPYKVGSLYNDGAKCGVVVEVWDEGKSGKIISLTQTYEPLQSAKATCKALGEGWYLPSAEELQLLSYDKAEYEAINKALSAYGAPLKPDAAYWSSTETGEVIHKRYPTVYTVTMDGNCSQEPTCNGYYVRAFALFGSSARPTTTLARPKTSAPYKVGDYYNDGVKDGIVFEVSAGGNHGKIVSIAQPLVKLRWSTDNIYGVSAKSKSNGAKNMEKIKLLDNWQSRYPAAKWCSDLGEGWYLPSINELVSVYMNKSVIENALKCEFKDELLSSTESNKRPQNKYINDRRVGSVYVLRMSDAHISRARATWINETRAVAKF